MTPTARLVASASVLMPFDGSLQAVGIFPIARTVARVMEASLHLVLPGGKSDVRARLAMLDDPGSEATTHELIGNLAVELVRLATCNPDSFIVAPAQGPSGPESELDPFPQEILRLARCPVLIAHLGQARTPWKLGRILVPQDGTATAAKSLCPAARLAARAGAEMVIVHVSSLQPPEPQEPGSLELPAYVDQPQHELPAWVAAFLDRVRHLCNLPPHMTLRFHWACGDPGREIVTLARRKKVDLITVSWGHSTDPHRAQVFRQILHEAPCPILVLPCEPC